jgi:hypothetical protein
VSSVNGDLAGSPDLKYPLEHFELQLEFARIVARTLHVPLLTALLTHTTYYRRVGARHWHSLDPSDPAWVAFTRLVTTGGPPAEAAFEMYARSLGTPPEPHHGCFRFDYDASHRVLRLHFRNPMCAERGPLAREHQGERLQELRAITVQAAREHPEASAVAGASWLYGLQAYRRLFPPEYTRDLRPEAKPRFHSATVWGQFLDSTRRVKTAPAVAFLNSASLATDPAGFAAALPHPTYRPHCEFRYFLAFYQVTP